MLQATFGPYIFESLLQKKLRACLCSSGMFCYWKLWTPSVLGTPKMCNFNNLPPSNPFVAFTLGCGDIMWAYSFPKPPHCMSIKHSANGDLKNWSTDFLRKCLLWGKWEQVYICCVPGVHYNFTITVFIFSHMTSIPAMPRPMLLWKGMGEGSFLVLWLWWTVCQCHHHTCAL